MAETDGETETDTEADAGSATEPTSATVDPSQGSNSGTSSDTTSGGTCVPGMSIACTCPNGATGAQVCNSDGASYGPCECAGTDSGSNTTDDSDSGSSDEGDDTTTGEVCEDPGDEPNDDEDSATDLGEQGCNDAPGMFTGVLAGPDDVDWFGYHGSWGALCGFADPSPGHNLTASDDIRICVFPVCDNGNAQFNCPGDSVEATSPEGVDGCCDTGSFQFNLNCSGLDESATYYVRLDQAAEGACVNYTVVYDTST